jgi:hypothetical protein
MGQILLYVHTTNVTKIVLRFNMNFIFNTCTLAMEQPYTQTLIINVNNDSNFIFNDDSHSKFEP